MVLRAHRFSFARRVAVLAVAGLMGACAKASISTSEGLDYLYGDGGPRRDGGLPVIPDRPNRQDAGGSQQPSEHDARVQQPDVDSGSSTEVDSGVVEPIDAGGGGGGDDGGLSSDDAGSGCGTGLTLCGASCVDLDTSAANCGDCGHACPGGGACDGAGLCKAPQGCTAGRFEGHDYFFCTTGRTWAEARTACQSADTDLTVIEDSSENTYVRNRGTGWIGVNDIAREKTFRVITPGASGNGTKTPTFTFWAQGEPSNNCGNLIDPLCLADPGEDCVEIQAAGTWNDTKCGNDHAYICESY